MQWRRICRARAHNAAPGDARTHYAPHITNSCICLRPSAPAHTLTHEDGNRPKLGKSEGGCSKERHPAFWSAAQTSCARLVPGWANGVDSCIARGNLKGMGHNKSMADRNRNCLCLATNWCWRCLAYMHAAKAKRKSSAVRSRRAWHALQAWNAS